VPQITTRDAVTRALAAMEIAESCPDVKIRSSFESLAETWLAQAAEAARDDTPATAKPEQLSL
jgi:hypothetical protein